MALAVNAATAKIAARKATDKAVDASNKAVASSSVSNRAATDLDLAIMTASFSADTAATIRRFHGGSYEKASMKANLDARKVVAASRKVTTEFIATVAKYAEAAAAANDASNAYDAAMVAIRAANDAARAAKDTRAAAEAAAADLGVCAVCLKLQWGETSCGHSVCSLCVKKWTLQCNKKRVAPTCPICRKPLA